MIPPYEEHVGMAMQDANGETRMECTCGWKSLPGRPGGATQVTEFWNHRTGAIPGIASRHLIEPDDRYHHELTLVGHDLTGAGLFECTCGWKSSYYGGLTIDSSEIIECSKIVSGTLTTPPYENKKRIGKRKIPYGGSIRVAAQPKRNESSTRNVVIFTAIALPVATALAILRAPMWVVILTSIPTAALTARFFPVIKLKRG